MHERVVKGIRLLDYNGHIKSQFAAYLRSIAPDDFSISPVIRARLIEWGWTPPDPEAEPVHLGQEDMVSLYPDVFDHEVSDG